MNAQNTILQLKQRLDENINDLEAALALGNGYYDQGNAAMAVLYYRHALDLDPTRSGVRTDLGAMYWRNENISLAEQAFRQVIEQDSSFGQAYVNLGMLLQYARGNVSEARAIWQKILAIDPNHEVAEKARELLKNSEALIN